MGDCYYNANIFASIIKEFEDETFEDEHQEWDNLDTLQDVINPEFKKAGLNCYLTTCYADQSDGAICGPDCVVIFGDYTSGDNNLYISNSTFDRIVCDGDINGRPSNELIEQVKKIVERNGLVWNDPVRENRTWCQ